MNFNKAPLALLTALVLSSGAAFAVDDPVTPPAAASAVGGSGKVNFIGSIIDAPCSLDAESKDQTVRMDEISNKTLANQGESSMQSFNIELKQCDISKMKKVKVTFGGDADITDPTLLGIAGSAKGAGIALTNGSGAQVKLGEASAARTLLEGNNTLAFGAFLRGTTAKDVAVTPGEFTATANFMLAYE
ncbi:fimbrial protein [Pseudomonas donghuensis]|uniref:Type 1 fimbrial protein n=1 Tax=Pseudomonas donghuensis TaxID=1163398 RepID=A0AAP0SKI0_9PSED|nr:fimbrial protein [Pseudomonas donghuensis]KDO00466.2 type 1 fimbrial protein [Pseudomonas donghuensis]MCP6690159.1 type 1 fimbrial protein [Pseudomonas donghuensis]